jgi:hypothetical protein
MDDFDFGFEGEALADALLEGVDFNQLTEGWVLGTLVESPETIRDLLTGKTFPMSKEQVELLYLELLSDELITEDYLIKDLPEGEYSIDHVIEMMTSTFSKMLSDRHEN